jgi:hypothetical protein
MMTLSPKMASFRFIYHQLSRMAVKTWGIRPEFSISNQLDLCSVLRHPVRVIEPLFTGFQEAA